MIVCSCDLCADFDWNAFELDEELRALLDDLAYERANEHAFADSLTAFGCKD